MRRDVCQNESLNKYSSYSNFLLDAANILSYEAGRKIGYSSIFEDDARQMVKGMGMNDWHTNVLLEPLKITREGYLSNISSAVEQVTGNKPISFHQFTKDYASAFR
jgi:hypothetical protein